MFHNRAMWQMRVLGPFRLSNEAANTLLSLKVQALLGLLAATGATGWSRERLVGLLWQDASDARARQSLRQLLSDLRREAPVVQGAGDDLLMLDPKCVHVDMWRFQVAAQSTEIALLEEATALYDGPLLQGIGEVGEAFGTWLAGERERIERLVCTAFERLAKAHERAGRHEAAVPLLQRWLALDPCNEIAHRALMQAWLDLGRRSDALAQYERCRDALRRVFGAAVQAETVSLHESIRATVRAATPNQKALAHAATLTVAVLPLATWPREPALEAIAQSIADDLSSALARRPGLAVVAQPAVRSAAERARGDLLYLAETLAARYLITGGIRRTPEGRLRISLNLVAGEDALYLWSLQEELDATPVTTALDERVAAWAGNVELQVSVARTRRHVDAPEDRDAWDLVRDANSTLFARGWAEESIQAALQTYRDAIAADPRHALARAQMAIVMALAHNMGLLCGDAPRDEAKSQAERALELEPRNSEVLGYAGCALADLGDPRRAEPFIQRAVDTNPANPQAWAALGATQLQLGRTERGIELLQRGLRLSPDDYRRPVWYTLLAIAYQRLAQLDQAAEMAEAGCRSDLRYWPARIALAAVELERGRHAQAVEAMRDALHIRPRLGATEVRVWVRKRHFDPLMTVWAEAGRSARR